jgi:hypothetical protein
VLGNAKTTILGFGLLLSILSCGHYELGCEIHACPICFGGIYNCKATIIEICSDICLSGAEIVFLGLKLGPLLVAVKHSEVLS